MPNKKRNKRNERRKPPASLPRRGLTKSHEPKSIDGVHVYGLTVRHNPKYKPDGSLYTSPEKKDLYQRLVGWFEAKGLKLDNIYFEEKNGLHFHARAEYPKKLYFKAWQKQPFHIMFCDMYDETGWKEYCAKEQLQEQLNYYINNYAFSDTSSNDSPAEGVEEL